MFFQHQKLFQHPKGVFSAPGVSQHPRCFITKNSVFAASERCFLRTKCFLRTRRCFFSINEGVFSQHFFSTSAVVFSQLQNGVFPAPKVFFLHPNGVFCAKRCFFSTATVFFEHRQKRDTETETDTESETETMTETKTDTETKIETARQTNKQTNKQTNQTKPNQTKSNASEATTS